MNIRKRTILTILGATCIIMLVVGILAHTTFLNSYRELEILDLQSETRRLFFTLEHEVENLSALANDWAAWDDTYQFIQDGNEDYLDSNMVDGTFNSLGINLIIYFDTEGRIVYEKAYDLENQVEIQPLESTLQYFSSNPDFFLLDENNQMCGFFSADGTPVMFAINPILTSLEQGPVKGFLLFTKNFEGELLSKLLEVTDSEVTILAYNNSIIPKSGYSVHLDESKDVKIFVNEVNKDFIEYYSVLNDCEENPIFMVKQEKKRTIYKQGLESISNLLWSLILSSITAGMILILSLETNLLSRLSTLNDSLKHYRKDKLGKGKILLSGNDELTDLSIEIDQTLKSLKNAQNKLNSHLEYEDLMVNISTKFINLPVKKIDVTIEEVLINIGKTLEIDRCHTIILQVNTSLTENVYEWRREGVQSFKDDLINTDIRKFRWLFTKLDDDGSIIIQNPDDLPEIANQEKAFLKKNNIVSAFCAPLKIRGKLIGLLIFQLVEKRKIWNDQIPFFLEMTANIIANAVDRKRNEQQLRLSRQFQYSLNQITKTSIEKESYNSSIRALSKQLRSLINSDYGWLILIDQDMSYHIHKNGKRINPDQDLMLIIDHLLKKTSETFFIHNSSKKSIKKGAPNFDNLGKSFIAVPLLAKNQRLGLVILANQDNHFFSPLETDISQQAGPQITLAIIKIRALEEAQEVSKELSDLRSTVVDISSELELHRLMDSILKQAVKLLNGEGGEFYIYHEEKKELETVTSLNMDKDYRGIRIKIGQGAAGRAIQTGKIFSIKDYSSWSNRLTTYDETKIRASISTPLMVGDRILGCISVFQYSLDNHFTKNDQHLLTIFAQHASIAIDNAMMFKKIQEMARIDEVTGLLNRRALNEIAEYEIARAIRLSRPIAVAMVDLDNYKQINDSHSHIVGDKVLKEIARLFRENVRNIDIIGRYGGDECVIIMPETNYENAMIAVERIRNVLEITPVRIEDMEFRITACFGISSYTENPPLLEKIIEEADTAMYAAKEAGRNCIRVFQNL